MNVIDSHCHLHDSEFYPENREEAYRQSLEAGVAMICVGTDARSSAEAVEFARTHSNCYAVVGIHPHEAKDGNTAVIRQLVVDHRSHIVGIGEIGLDYFYDHSPHDVQQQALREQLSIAREFDLPVSFHIREAFGDFWPIYDDFSGIRGVMHSFTDTQENLEQGFKRGLYVGINGISTFTKESAQQALYRDVPLDKILLETDAPFLTPKPYRGTICELRHVRVTAEFLADLRQETLEQLAKKTTTNAQTLFNLT